MIRRLSSLNNRATWETPSCAVCSEKNFASHHTKNGFNIVRCVNDGLLFVSPRPNNTAPYYSEAYYEGAEIGTYHSYESHAGTMSETWTTRLARIESMLGKKGRLLDVGAATGRFVHLAGKAGWAASGVELSQWAVNQGRQQLGVDLHLGTLPHPDLDAASFDVVTMFDVIEHLTDPRAVLEGAALLLKPGGVLALSTGAVPHLDPRATSSWYFPPWHLYYFSVETITELLELTGFQVCEIDIESSGSPYALMTAWAQRV
ncbi:MAG TPA: class I SAM-dependent methyltransferase [Gemmatimonadaceae bacterium]|nr:class I SAM-dependent methyltransferase [Gemmatimonadaceae bacterium]